MPSLTRPALFVLLAALPLPALAQDSAGEGEQIAQRWCADCHLVSPDQRLASGDAPAFESIATNTEGDFLWLAAFLAEPHPAMPRMSLTRQQIRDLSAYLAGLRE